MKYIMKKERELERNKKVINDVEMKLDEGDKMAESTEVRLSHDEVFHKIKSIVHRR